MKKIFFIMTLLNMILFTAVASAETVRLEGENYTEKSYSGGYKRAFNSFSNGKALYTDVSAVDNECVVRYIVNVAEDGMYNMEGVTSRFDHLVSTDFAVRINESEVISLNPVLIENYTWFVSHSNIMAKYNFGNFRLKAGDNNIEIVFVKDDAHGTAAKYITILDYFDFIPVTPEFKLKEIKSQTNTANVFVKEENAVFEFEFTALADKRKEFNYTLYNENDKKINNSTVTVPKGEDHAILNLGAMFTGWYKLEISGVESEKNKIFFCVVPRAEANITDSPFGIDKFNGSLASSEKMYNTAGLIGFDRIRHHANPYRAYTVNDYLASHTDYHTEAMDLAGLTPMMIYTSIDGSKEAPDNLIEAYNMNKVLAEHYKGQGHAYEIWNEEEADFYSQPADVFASFFKAVAIGISDGDEQAIKLPGGYGATPENFFVRLLLRNDISKYSDAYAYHNHNRNGNGKNYNEFIEGIAKAHTNASLAYDPSKPIWVTEAGICMDNVDSEEIPPHNSLLSQARYYVVSTVQQLSYGVDKSFWFRMEHFMESGVEWGSYDAENNPYPVINSVAMLTSKLKNAEYKGLLNNTGDTEGHVFYNGENDVAVLWTNSEGKCQIYTEAPVTVTDIFGKTSIHQPVQMPGGGMVNIPVSYNPVFIEFEGTSDGRNYYEKRAVEKNSEAKTYDEADRIVLQQLWQEQDMVAAKSQGYSMNGNSAQKITVNVYNFNDTVQSGVLNITSGSSVRDTSILDINQDEFDYSIEPMSSQSFEIEVSLNENAEPGEIGFLKLSGTLTDGRKISESIAAFYFDSDNRTVSDYETFSEYSNADRWAVYNHAPGVSVTQKIPAEGVVEFDVTSENNNAWHWPTYTLSEYATDEEGITFYIRSVSGKEQAVNVYAYCTNGAYWLGQPESVSYDGEWKQIVIPWHKFLVFSSSGDESGFDPKKIRSVGIGGYATQGDYSYQIKDVGFYNSDSPADMSDMGKAVKISGVREVYRRNEFVHAEVSMDTEKDITVRIGDEFINDYEISEGKVIINYVPQRRGVYDLHVIGTDNWNYKNSASVTFIVK